MQEYKNETSRYQYRSYRYKNGESVGTAKGWRTVCGYRYFDYGGAFYRVVIVQIKGERDS